MRTFHHIGKYFLLLGKVFKKPENMGLYRKQIFNEISSLGFGSLGLVALISFFMGAVIVIQTASNIDSAFIPKYTIGFASRQSFILEMGPTVIALILAGKIGSNIASEIGTMKISEQIDALEIMGVNSASYLILPKIIAAVFINPLLVILSIFLGIFGGWVVVTTSGVVTTDEFIMGIQYDFKIFPVIYSLTKTVFFAFVITSIPAYHGYTTHGGALEVGKSSTKAVVYSSIVILILNYVITQIMLI